MKTAKKLLKPLKWPSPQHWHLQCQPLMDHFESKLMDPELDSEQFSHKNKMITGTLLLSSHNH